MRLEIATSSRCSERPRHFVAPSISREKSRRRQGDDGGEEREEVVELAKVAAGPDNPLGRYRLGLSLECCGIHSTNAPRSIYGFETHGCIRLAPADAVDLFSRVSVGTRVEIVYETVLLARAGGGRSFVEVHADVYGRAGGRYEKVRSTAESREIESASEAPGWDEAFRRVEGIATSLSTSFDLLGEESPDRIRDPAVGLRK